MAKQLSLKTRRGRARGFNTIHLTAWSGRNFTGLGNRAILTTEFTDPNANVTFYARTPGVSGNDITVAFVDPNETPLVLPDALTVAPSEFDISDPNDGGYAPPTEVVLTGVNLDVVTSVLLNGDAAAFTEDAGELTVDVDGLAVGIYWITVEAPDGYDWTPVRLEVVDPAVGSVADPIPTPEDTIGSAAPVYGAPIEVNVTDSDIVVTLGVDADGHIVSTARDAVQAVLANHDARDLVWSHVARGADGYGVVEEFAETALEGAV